MFHYLGSTLNRLKEEISASDDEAVKRHNRSGLFLALALVIPLVTVVSTYIFFRSWTPKVFHFDGFQLGYYNGIFRYRILGRGLVQLTYHFFLKLTHGSDWPLPMPADPQGSVLFYLSYLSVNGIFFFFSNLLLLILLWDWKNGISDARLSQYFYLVFLWALSLAMVTPYDQTGYFFLLLALLSTRLNRPLLMYAILGIAAIAGTLNRETEFLATPALWTVALCTRSNQARRYYRAGLFHLVLFFACYLALRVLIPGQASVSGIVTLGGAWAIPSLCVFVALYCINAAMFQMEYASKMPGIILAIFSAPYLMTILVTGELHELRLLIPMLMGLLFTYDQLFRLRQEYQSPTAAVSSHDRKPVAVAVTASPMTDLDIAS